MRDFRLCRPDRLILAFYFLYTVANVYPYSHPAFIGKAVYGWGDALVDVWLLGTSASQLLRDPLHPWDGPGLYPFPRTLTFNDAQWGLGLLGAPIGWTTGNWLLARNVLLLLGFWLSAWWTYRLALRVGASRFGAFIAGLLYGFCSLRFHHVRILKMAFGPLIPLFFLYLTRWSQTGRLLDLWKAALTWALQMVSGLYYGFFLLTLGPLYGLLMRSRPPADPVPRVRKKWETIIAVVGLASIGLGVTFGLLLPYWESRYLFGLEHDIGLNRQWAARVTNYLATESRIGRKMTARWWDWERPLWVGVLAWAAFLAPPWAGRVQGTLWAMTALSFLLSLGPQTPVFQVAYSVLPYFSAMRYPARWGMMVIFFMALLAGLGITRLQARCPARFRWALMAFLSGVAGIDLWHAPLRVESAPTPPAVYARLRAHREPGAVAAFPLYSNYDIGSALYGSWTLAHQKPTLGAYSVWPIPGAEWIRTGLADFPSPHALWLAARLNVRYFVFHAGLFSRLGQDELFRRYEQSVDQLPRAWVRRLERVEGDVLLTLNLEQIRQDLWVAPPPSWRWASVPPSQVQVPVEPPARTAITDGDPRTVWTIPYTGDWQVWIDLGRPVYVRAIRIRHDPKDKMFFLSGSADGQDWTPIHTVPWWIWVGLRRLPYAREYPSDRPGQAVLLCTRNWVRYLRITSTRVAGHIAIRDIQLIWEP